MKELEFTVEIEASKHKVWNTMWQDATFRAWAGLIDPGTYMKGELKEGGEVEFISSENGYGVTSLVEKIIPSELLVLRHEADTQEIGTKTRKKEWTGGTEAYTLTEKDGVTTLTVAFDVPPNQEAYFTEHYPLALNKLKELAEL